MSPAREPTVEAARAALAEGRLQEAVEFARRSRAVRADDALAAWIEGRALLDLERVHEAAVALADAVRLAPGSSEVQATYGAALAALGHVQDAYQAYVHALELDPLSHDILVKVGSFLLERGEVASARTCFDAAAHGGSVEALAGRLAVCEREGQIDDAVALLAALPERFPTSPALVFSIARLMRRRGEPQQARTLLEDLLQLQLPPRVTVRVLHFLGMLHEELGDHELAFATHARANELSGLHYDARAHEERVERILSTFTRERFAREPRVHDATALPILIVGMPRSGTSLVEEILASHPLVHGAGELDDLHRIQEHLDLESRTELEESSRIYRERLASQAQGRPRVTDKLPHNFLALGTAALLVPGARVIHCRRDPLDTCLSIYFHDFHASHDYATDLGALGHQWRLYETLMAHWREHLPLAMHELRYEELVADPEIEIRRLLAFLGLEWDAAVLRFHESGRTVRTASWESVRRPIHTASVGRASRHETRLAPLVRALERRA